MHFSSLGQRATSQSTGASRASGHSRECDTAPQLPMSPTVISLSISSARAQLRSPCNAFFHQIRACWKSWVQDHLQSVSC